MSVTDDGQERRRRRSQRGVTSSAYGAAGKVPLPQRERRPLLAVAAVLLIVLGAAVAGLVALRSDQRVTVIVARTDISQGQQIELSDLTTARVAYTGIDLVPADQGSTVVGQYAQVNVTAGTLIDRSMVGSQDALVAGKFAIGMSLKAGQYPKDLQAGDHVDVVAVPAEPPGNLHTPLPSESPATDKQIKQGLVEARDALVLAVDYDSNTGTARVSVAIPDDEQEGVATAASTQTAVLVRASRSNKSGS